MLKSLQLLVLTDAFVCIPWYDWEGGGGTPVAVTQVPIAGFREPIEDAGRSHQPCFQCGLVPIAEE